MTLNALWRLIRSLFVALGAPAAMVALVWRRDMRAMAGFAHLLQRMRGRGWWLRYDGEDAATVARRIARLEWIARDPQAAVRHMARRLSGHERARGAFAAPESWTPPALAPITPAFAPRDAVAIIDSS